MTHPDYERDMLFCGVRRKRYTNSDTRPHVVAFRTIRLNCTVFALSTLQGVHLGRWLSAGYPVREYNTRRFGWAQDAYENALGIEWRCVRRRDFDEQVRTIR